MASDPLGMGVPAVKKRATITRVIGTKRLPGVVKVTFLATLEKLGKAGLLPFVHEQYGAG